MKNLKILAGLGLLAVAGGAQAGVSSTWTLASDYDFRGNSQSAKDPALQGSIDYAHDSGWYVGAWGSNVDFGIDEPDYEVDLYTGYTWGAEGAPTFDIGAVYYAYPQESDFDYLEVYASVAIDWFKAKLWYSPAFGGDAAEDLAEFTTGDDKVSAWYVEGNATFPLPANFSVLLHAGYSTGDYWDNAFGDDQFDYSAGVGYTIGKFNLALKYVDTDGDVKVKTDAFNNEGRAIFTVATTFPWTAE
ncbi:MAG: TorF family putative porin [Steroidobacteraceae bacterium]